MKVAIIMGSKSDLPIMNDAATILEQFGVDYEIKIVSAHRTPNYMYEFCKTADNEYDLIIAGAGGSAHLPGMVAAMVNIPVIGVPVKLKTLDGIDSLLSIVQMPGGVPVLTVAINGAKNAGIAAVKILAIHNPELTKKLTNYRTSMAEAVLND